MISSASHELTDPDARDVVHARQGDADAYARIIRRHQVEIGSRMWRFTRDKMEHDELVQEVFVEAYLGLGRFRGEAPLGHWLARIATNVGYKFWKNRYRNLSYSSVPIEEWAEIAATDPEDLDAARAADMLHRLLDQLPPRDRLILTLRYVEDLSVEEAAAQTGWTQTMVKVQAWRARQKLRKLLEQAGIEVN
ncbi:MAG: sigma-70 family RNA polymerase sigma factor [Thermodesulfobacteriota bacterium]